MSIQRINQSKILFLLLEKLYIIFLYDFFITLIQKALRATNSNNEIFYDYYNSYTHPFIKKSFYKENAPFSWCNFQKSKIIWAVQFPSLNYDFTRDIVIEPNDHILTLSHFFGATNPSECIDKIPEVKKFLGNKKVKAILISGPGLRDQFIYYFGREYLHKVKEYPIMRCEPKFSINNKDNLFINDNPNFICIAADYKIKAVEILINAWQKVTKRTKLLCVIFFQRVFLK